MKKLLTYLIKEITGSKDFSIQEEADDQVDRFTITAKPDQIGIIIGKGGHTIKAIQTLLRVRARLDNKKVFVNVAEAS